MRTKRYKTGDAKWVRKQGHGRVWWIRRTKWNAYMREYMKRRRRRLRRAR